MQADFTGHCEDSLRLQMKLEDLGQLQMKLEGLGHSVYNLP